MELKSNIPELIQKLERIKVQVGAAGGIPPIPDFSDAMLHALNAGMAKMNQRIFQRGQDAEGNSLGKYTGRKSKVTSRKFAGNKKLQKNLKGADVLTEYEKFRLAHGRQIGYKDLSVTQALEKSIETVKDGNGKVVIAIVNPETAAIAGYQEEQIGKIRGGGKARIFSLSESEYNYIRQEGNAAIRATIQKIIKEA